MYYLYDLSLHTFVYVYLYGGDRLQHVSYTKRSLFPNDEKINSNERCVGGEYIMCKNKYYLVHIMVFKFDLWNGKGV